MTGFINTQTDGWTVSAIIVDKFNLYPVKYSLETGKWTNCKGSSRSKSPILKTLLGMQANDRQISLSSAISWKQVMSLIISNGVLVTIMTSGFPIQGHTSDFCVDEGARWELCCVIRASRGSAEPSCYDFNMGRLEGLCATHSWSCRKQIFCGEIPFGNHDGIPLLSANEVQDWFPSQWILGHPAADRNLKMSCASSPPNLFTKFQCLSAPNLFFRLPIPKHLHLGMAGSLPSSPLVPPYLKVFTRIIQCGL